MNDQTERHMHTEVWVPATTKLIVDLIGPYVVHFVNGIARVHAPICEDHHANILTDTNDIPLDGLDAPPPLDGYQPPGYIYRFKNGTGPSGRRGRCGSYYPEKLLVLNLALYPVESNTCHLTFERPNPDMIVPLIPEQIFIQRNGAAAWFNQQCDIINGSYARGLRLIYLNCPVQPKIEVQSLAKTLQPKLAELLVESLDDFDPNALGFDPPMYQFTMRFVSNSSVPDNHHEDAYNCFQAMRLLVADAIRWRVDFDDAVTPSGISAEAMINLVQHSGKHPVDCGAAVVAIQS